MYKFICKIYIYKNLQHLIMMLSLLQDRFTEIAGL